MILLFESGILRHLLPPYPDGRLFLHPPDFDSEPPAKAPDATALRAITAGNMLPALGEDGNDRLRPVTTICDDQTEFVVNEVRDRGTHQAYGVVTNARDFMHVPRFYVEQWEHRNRS